MAVVDQGLDSKDTTATMDQGVVNSYTPAIGLCYGDMECASEQDTALDQGLH